MEMGNYAMKYAQTLESAPHTPFVSLAFTRGAPCRYGFGLSCGASAHSEIGHAKRSRVGLPSRKLARGGKGRRRLSAMPAMAAFACARIDSRNRVK